MVHRTRKWIRLLTVMLVGALSAAAIARPIGSPTQCTLTTTARQGAMRSFAKFAARHSGRVTQIQVKAHFTGDKPALRRFLIPMLKREAECCSAMKFKLRPTSRGYEVALTAGKDDVGTALAVLSVLQRKAPKR